MRFVDLRSEIWIGCTKLGYLDVSVGCVQPSIHIVRRIHSYLSVFFDGPSDKLMNHIARGTALGLVRQQEPGQTNVKAWAIRTICLLGFCFGKRFKCRRVSARRENRL